MNSRVEPDVIRGPLSRWRCSPSLPVLGALPYGSYSSGLVNPKFRGTARDWAGCLRRRVEDLYPD